MTERYIIVTDEECMYFLDTEDENYKTLEDFEEAEFEQAKKDSIDIKEYEDAILVFASDKYWEWVYDNYLDCSDVEYLLNKLTDENSGLKEYKELVANVLLKWSQKNMSAKQLQIVIAIMDDLGVDLE